MKVLITGGTGFIGSNLTKRLLSQGWKVKVLVRKGHVTKKNNPKVVVGDLTDLNSINEAVKDVEVVFNCAAALPYHKLPEREYWNANVLGVKNVVKACQKQGVDRLVHVSTVGVYGAATDGIIDERSPLVLGDVYSRTKAQGDKLVFSAIKSKKLQATIVRPTIGYGPGDLRPGFLNLFKLIKKRFFIPIGNGENYFHTIYVENLLDALILVAEKKESVGTDFIIGDEPCSTMGEILKELSKITNVELLPLKIPLFVAEAAGRVFDVTGKFGLPAPLNSQRVNFLTENRRYSIKKAKNMLGYKPEKSLPEALKETYSWYRENGYL